MTGETVLIIEDDPTLVRVLTDNFAAENYDVLTAQDGKEGLGLAREHEPDLIILDIMLPKMNGYELCRLLRKDGLDMPVIMLTAKGQESDIVLGLNLGADDYVTKPFSMNELLARSEAFLRRRHESRQQTHRFGRFELDRRARRLLDNGEEVELTPKEFSLLELFVTQPGRAVTRDEILHRVWGRGVFVTARSVDRCVNTLRRKIESDPHRPRLIHTIREIGYRFDAGE